MKKTLYIILIGLLITAFASYQNFAQPKKERMQFKERVMEKLDLTDQQEEQIETLRLKHQKEMIDLKADLKKQELTLKELKSKKNFTRNDFLNTVKKISEAKNNIALAQANHKMDVYELLTDEQKDKWLKFGDRMHHRMKLMKHRMMDPGMMHPDEDE